MESSRKKELIEKALHDQASREELKELYAILTNDRDDAGIDSLLQRGWDTLDPSVKLDDRSSENILKDIVKKRKPMVTTYILRVAASVVLLLSFYFAIQYFIWTPESINTNQVAAATAGTTQKVELPDGSTVWMNAGSAIEYPSDFGVNTRNVKLTGEAFFDVRRNEKMPFVITTREMETTVLGTSFNVRAYEGDQDLVVSVATGKVRVSSASGEGEVLLTPNKQSFFNVNTGDFTVKDVVASDFNDWREGVLRLNGSLEEISKVLERKYDKKFVFESETIRSCQIAAKYENESLDNVLNSIDFILGIDHAVKGDSVLLNGKGCGK